MFKTIFLGASILSAGMLAGCNKKQMAPNSASHPFVGCWQSKDGLSREAWVADPSAWLFGYALDRNEDGAIGFFEQTRLEVSGDKTTFVVIGDKGDIVRFEREDIGDPNVFKFVNAAHDFPQVITYRPTADRLDAEISKLDGSNVIPFLKVTCK